MTVDILLQAGNQLACWQWLDARGLGDLTQDADPESPTFGEYGYQHTAPGAFEGWRGTGLLESGVGTFFTGWWGMLRIDGDAPPQSVQTWCQDFAAGIVLEGFSAVAGDGVALVRPEDVQQHMDSIGLPRQGWFGTTEWSDPQAWALLGPAMTGDVRAFDGVQHRSTIDNNVWSPTTYPQGWEIVAEPDPDEWAAGTTYATGAVTAYQGASYECRQGHTAQVGWEPPAAPALWSPL